MEAEVAVDSVSKRFGDTVAVDGISFEVYRGEIFTLLGPSGCGKTTTLRIIAGLEKPDTGRVYIGGRDVTDLPPQKRDVCLVFQEYAVFPHMNVFENIAFGLKVRRIPSNDLRKRVVEVAETLGLTDYLNSRAGRVGLSEQQKIALARCMVVEPRVLLLDEPLTLVDAKTRERMRRELREIQRRIGITMLYVTHDQLEALMLSDRIAVMNRGRLVQIGTPIEIYDNPQSLFVAQFIGSPTMNFIEGVLKKYGGNLFLERDDFKMPLDAIAKYYDLEQLVDREVVISFRPEDSSIDAKGALEGSIELIEVVGDKLALHIKVLKDVVVKVYTSIYEDVAAGSKVRVSLNPGKVHVFDKTSGRKPLPIGGEHGIP
ncbi:MAG: ABC transporter ATP-binding protein [Ignisphaera sp.]